MRAADPQHVAVVQHPLPGDPLLVDERTVARQAVVGEGPYVTDVLELGVQARHTIVVGQAQVAHRVAADPQPALGRLECEDLLLVVRVAIDQERRLLALGRDLLLELARG